MLAVIPKFATFVVVSESCVPSVLEADLELLASADQLSTPRNEEVAIATSSSAALNNARFCCKRPLLL